MTVDTSGWVIPSDYLTAEEVAAELRTTPKVVGNLRRAGALPGRRLGRRYLYRRADVEAWFEAGIDRQGAEA